MNDIARQAPPQSDSVGDSGRRLPIKEVLPLFRDAGLPRDIRSLQRYCESGLLDGFKELTATGETWFIAEYSIAPAITQLKQMHAAKGQRQATTDEDMSGPVGNQSANHSEPGNDGHSATTSDTDDPENDENKDEQASTGDDTPSDMSGALSETQHQQIVAQYELRLTDKDGEISFYREELTERRAQLSDMKSIIDSQNQLLGAINRSSEKIFTAIANGIRKPADPNSDDEYNADQRKIRVIETSPQDELRKFSNPREDSERYDQPNQSRL